MQEVVPHKETFFKVYVLGEQMFWNVQKSLPESYFDSDAVRFDSGDRFKAEECKFFEAVCNGELVLPFKEEFIQRVVSEMGDFTGLSLFGLDVVVHSETGDHFVVDLNYFTSYNFVSDEVVGKAFRDLALKKCSHLL